jgi:hypothetical protein
MLGNGARSGSPRVTTDLTGNARAPQFTQSAQPVQVNFEILSGTLRSRRVIDKCLHGSVRHLFHDSDAVAGAGTETAIRSIRLSR